MSKPYLPKQHGAWSMLLIPFLFGVIIGKPTWGHLSLFISWIFFYLSSYPFLMAQRVKRKRKEYFKWAFILSVPAFLGIIYPVYTETRLIYFGLSMIPFFLLNLYFSRQKNERAFLNDVCAVFVFCIGGLASYFYGVGDLNRVGWELFLHSFLYFLGTVFYVKTMIREKKNIRYKYASWAYHFGLVPLFFIMKAPIQLLAYLPSIIRAVVLYGKNVKVKTIGIVEIVNSIYFFIVILIIYLPK